MTCENLPRLAASFQQKFNQIFEAGNFCVRSCLSRRSAEHPRTLQEEQSLQISLAKHSAVVPEELRELSRVVRDHSPPAGSPSPSPPPPLCSPSPPTRTETPRCSFKAGRRRVCGEGPVLPASFCTAPFPLPSEFQVNGSRRVEAAIPLLLRSVHLPLSASSGGGDGTPARAGRNAKEPARGAAGGARGRPAGLSAPGPGLVRMPGGQAGRVGGGRRGVRRRRAQSPAESRLRAASLPGGRCALQVSARPGSRRVWFAERR